MFKNSKEMSNSDISEMEEMEQTYKQQLKMLNSKIQEQQNSIDKLVDFVSARFGEDFSKSDINKRIKDLEKKVKEIKENDKCNDVIDKFKDTFDTMKGVTAENGKKIEELYAHFDNHEKEDRVYKKYIQDEFKDTNNSIASINYAGITNKFEKMLKEKNKGLEAKLKRLDSELDEKVSKMEELSYIFQANEEQINQVNQIIESMTDQTEGIVKKIDKNIQNSNDLSVDVTKLYKAMQKNEEAIADAYKLSKNSKKELDDAIKTNELKTSNIELDLNNYKTEVLNDIGAIKEYNIANDGNINEIKCSIKQTQQDISSILENNNIINQLSTGLEKTKQKVLNIQESYNDNSSQTAQKINGIEKNINKIFNALNKGQQLVLNIKENKKEIERFKLDLSKSEENLGNDISIMKNDILKNNETVKNDLLKNNEIIKNDILKNNEALKKYVNTQLEANVCKNNETIKNSTLEINKIKLSLDQSIQNVEKELLKLSKETQAIVNKQLNDSEDKKNKELNQYFKKVENTINKMNESISSMQEKSTQASRNLQIKIKSYIDNKNSNQINQVNDIVGKLSLSMSEREKLHQAKMEQILSKKLKEIQKENERIINKKIEELNEFMKNYNSNNNYKKVQQIEPYQPVKTKKQKMYDTIDTNQILKQSASNKKILPETKERKTQLLKFFYDDDDVN